MKLVFDTHGNDRQKEAIIAWADNTTTDIFLGGAKGLAKSYTGCALTFGDALMYAGIHSFIARKSLNDLVRFTTPTIHEIFRNWGLDKDKYMSYNGQYNYFQLYNGSRVFFLDAKYLPSDPDYHRFGSMQFTRGFIEEAGQFERKCKENLQASIGRWMNDEYDLLGKLFSTGNPSKNYTYSDYYKPHRDGKLPPHMKFIQGFPHDNKMLPAGYVQNLERTLTGQTKQRLLLGNWEYDDNPYALIEYEALVDLFSNSIDSGHRYITCDVARFGVDKTVIRVWDGLMCVKTESYNSTSIPDTVGHLSRLQHKYQIRKSHIILDEDGVGGGVKDVFKCRGFLNGSKPVNKNYQNLKTECYYKLADYINYGKIGINDDEFKEMTIEELELLEAVNTDKEGKLQIINKQDWSKKLGRSPDYADSLMMRMYFELKPRVKAVVKRIRN